MAEPREPQDSSDRLTERQTPAAGRIADSVLGGGCAGISCGCVVFTVLLAAVFMFPLILMMLFGILFTLMGSWESGPTIILEGPTLVFRFATVAAPCIAAFALFVAVVVGLVVGLLLHRKRAASTSQ